MDSKERDDVDEESLIRRRDKLIELHQRIEKANSNLKASGSSSSTLHDLQNISEEIQQLVIKNEATLRIHDELDKVFAAEEVGHSCDLCERDLAKDPERPGASLHSLQEACVLACGHVYHFKCLKGTTLDLDNRSTNPSCIFCISFSN